MKKIFVSEVDDNCVGRVFIFKKWKKAVKKAQKLISDMGGGVINKNVIYGNNGYWWGCSSVCITVEE